MPDLWDPNPDAGPPAEQPDPTHDDQGDRTREVKLKDREGRLRLPAYILIALVVVLATVLLLIVVMLLASS